MENENMNPTEATEEVIDDSVFDTEWGESPVEDDDMDLSDDGEATEEEAAEPEAEEGEPAEAEAEAEPASDEEPKPEEPKPETENQRFKLKYNGEESEVDREKVIELAQKGMDYDRVKGERDKFKADEPTMQRYKEQDSFLKELAESAGVTVEQLMEQTKARVLMSKDDKLTEEEALKQVREAAKKATEKKETEKAAEPSPEERRQAMFAKFMNAYPDVKADDIPKEVWEDAGRTFDLTGAYQRWENRKLRKEVELLRQNNKNKERSTGSRKSVGSAKPKDDFDDAWDSF